MFRFILFGCGTFNRFYPVHRLRCAMNSVLRCPLFEVTVFVRSDSWHIIHISTVGCVCFAVYGANVHMQIDPIKLLFGCVRCVRIVQMWLGWQKLKLTTIRLCDPVFIYSVSALHPRPFGHPQQSFLRH